MEAIYHFIQRKFNETKVNNFGFELFNLCSFELKKAFLASYMKHYIQNYLNFICMQCSILNIDCNIILQQKIEILKKFEQNFFNHDFKERKPLHELVSYVLEGNFEPLNKVMRENIIKPLESYIYEQTWIYKGRIQGESFKKYS